MLKAGIVGLPNVGKSTLFNAITNSNILAANYPFATIDPNVGIVLVKDERLDFLSSLYNPKKTTYTSYQFIDIAGLVKGASQGEGLGNQFLSNIRDVDAICQVVRCFENQDIHHVNGKVDPIFDVETIWLELTLADLDIIEKRISKIYKKALSKDKDAMVEYEVLKKIQDQLKLEKDPKELELTDDEKKLVKSFNLLTLKPMIYIANIDEDTLLDPNSNSILTKFLDYIKQKNQTVLQICMNLEFEISRLDDEEKQQFYKDYNIKTSGLNQIIFKTYEVLGLETYFTVGPDECRAWTFNKGDKAPKCAGIIHSDFERGFIKAEVLSYNDIYTYKNYLTCKEKGLVRIEGKDYIVKDGDLILFRFNV